MIDAYLQKYNDFIISLNQVDVITNLSSSLLENFPENLPGNISKPYNEALAQVVQQIADLESKNSKFPLKIEFGESMENLRPFIALVLTHVQANPEGNIDFQKAITAQHLIMICAHLDAFMSDSMKVICYSQPRVMSSPKNMAWENILKAENWDALIDKMIDDFVSEFVKPSVISRVEFLKTKLGLKIQIDEKELKLLEEAENIRHAFVHNGGRVDTKFAKNIGRQDLVIGSEIQVEKNYLDMVFSVSVNLGASIFNQVCEKFLKIDLEKNPLPVWTTGKDFVSE
jgi:hypothetical protein